MTDRLRRLLLAVAHAAGRLTPRPADLLAILSLAAISVGCWLERPSLGLIVPGGLVFGCLVLGKLRGGE